MFGFEDMLHSEFTELPFKIMFYVIIFLFGICIGSFLNVVILRLLGRIDTGYRWYERG